MFGAEKYRSWLQRPAIEKKNSKALDYRPLAEAAKESAEIMAGLSRDQLAFTKQQYEDAKPVFQQIVNQQMGIADQTAQQAQEDRQYNIDTYRPLERGLVADAARFNTDSYKEELATKAAADASRAFSATQGASERAMASMGINPNSGRFAGLSRQNEMGLAAQRAGAMTNARQQADNLGYARKMDAAGLGRNLTGASQGAYGIAMNAGNSAGQNQMAPGNQYMAGMGQGANTMASGRNMLQSGYTGVLNAQTSVYNADAQSGLDVGGLMKGVASMYGSGMFKP